LLKYSTSTFSYEHQYRQRVSTCIVDTQQVEEKQMQDHQERLKGLCRLAFKLIRFD